MLGRMKKADAFWIGRMGTAVCGVSLLASFSPLYLSTCPAEGGSNSFTPLAVQHPLEGAVLPQNMPAPVLLWRTNETQATGTVWSATFKASGHEWSFNRIRPMWRPDEATWQSVVQIGTGHAIELTITGLSLNQDKPVRCLGSVRFTISEEALRFPVFFREVNLPFQEAVKDPSKIRWRFGTIDRPTPPPVVLENLPVCGNCHSFSKDGALLAMDVDYANSKASYIITRTGREMTLATSDIITWDDYRHQDGQQTFGLLSQISPDGRYALSTVKDRSVFVPRPDLAFSQLFFPLKGVLAVYDREARTFSSLPGADDPAFVQSNPAWSPDGEWVAFARNTAAELKKVRDTGSILLTPEECEDFLKRGKEFKYDLYRIPFNAGKGGRPEPLRGASANGRSNFFPKYSPDGRWIVFCQASNYMLLQPDSELFIIPSEGGEARRLGCNLSRMNSWHSWSPDGRWLIFSSKAHSDYTQLYLARIAETGEASPPVWLAHMVEPGRAANIPEIVNLAPDAIGKIQERFLDDYSFTRAGNEFFRAGEPDRAIDRYEKALSLNANNAMAHQRLGFLLYRVKNRPQEAIQHSQSAVQLEPQNAFAHYDLGVVLAGTGNLSNAVVHLAKAVQLLPNGYDRQYSVTDMNYSLGEAYYRMAAYAQSLPPLEVVLRYQTNHAKANFLVAMAKAWLGETDATKPYYAAAIQSEPNFARLPDFLDLLSRNYVGRGLYSEGLKTSEQAYDLAVRAGRQDQAERLRQRIVLCKSKL
jgi:tetratricopeptide (TPR) repeat protein